MDKESELNLKTSVTLANKKYRVVKNIVFKKIDGVELKGDIFIPNTPGSKPAVLVVHGGAWYQRAGDMESVCRKLAEAGYVAFRSTYRLAPKHIYPKAVDDVKDAATWLKENAHKYEVDPNRIAGWGYSAGGHLLLLAAFTPKSDLKAIVSGGTPTDLTVWPNARLVKQFIGSDIEHKPDLWKEASPIFNIKEDSPPVFMYHGKWDKMVDHAHMENMQVALRAKKRIVETFTTDFLSHITVYLFSKESILRGIDFLNRQLL